jgi:hypothetical protein
MKNECAGLNFKVIFSNGKLIIKSKSFFSIKNSCLTFSLNDVKLIEISTKSIIQPFILFLFSLVFLSFSIAEKTLSSSFKTIIIVFLTLILIVGFSLVIIRLIFGTLKIELSDGKVIKIKLVKKRDAEKFISKIVY